MTSAAYLRVLDFDGLSMTGTDFDGCFLMDFDITAQFPLELVLAEAPGDFPTFIRGDPQDKVIPLHITIRNPTQTLIDELKRVFSPFRDPVYLRVQDDDGNARRMLVKSLGLTPWETHTGAYVASLEAPQPIWESDSLVQSTILMSGSDVANGYDFTITNIGNVMAIPEEIRIRGEGNKGNANDYIRRRPIVIAWRSPLQGVDSLGLPYPIDITDAQWDSAAEISASELLASGTDTRVFVDGVEMDRFIEGINTATTSVWCSIAFQAAKVATVESMTAGSPANGGDIDTTNPEGTSGFPDRGIILVDNEAIYYDSRTPTSFSNITRGYWGTTAANHAQDANAYWVEHEIVLVTDYQGATIPLERADREPIIDRSQSSNTQHVYATTDGLIAPSTIRPGQWQRELRGTNLAAANMFAQQLSGAIRIGNLQASQHFDSIALYIACFLDQASNRVVFDYLVEHNLILEVFLVDDDGFEARITRRDVRQAAAGASSYHVGASSYDTAGLPNTSRLHSRLTFHARNFIHVGRGWMDDTAFVVGLSGDREAQTFTLSKEVAIEGFQIQVSKSVGSDRNLEMAIYSLEGSGPGLILMNTETIATADIPTSPEIASVFVGLGNALRPIRLPAGSYALVFNRNGGTTGTVSVHGENESRSESGNRWEEVASVWTDRPQHDIALTVFGEDAENQLNADLETGSEFYVRNVIVKLNSSYTPKVVLGARSTMWLFQATLENLTAGQQLQLFYPLKADASSNWFLDPQEHTSFPRHGGDPPISSMGAVEPSDLAQWLRLQPGVNQLRYTEPTVPAGGAGHVELDIDFRHRWT